MRDDAQRQQEKLSRKRNRSWDARRSKATFDLPAEMLARIREISRELAAEYPGAQVKVGDVVRLLLEAGLEAYDAGELKPALHPQKITLFPK